MKNPVTSPTPLAMTTHIPITFLLSFETALSRRLWTAFLSNGTNPGSVATSVQKLLTVFTAPTQLGLNSRKNSRTASAHARTSCTSLSTSNLLIKILVLPCFLFGGNKWKRNICYMAKVRKISSSTNKWALYCFQGCFPITTTLISFGEII